MITHCRLYFVYNLSKHAHTHTHTQAHTCAHTHTHTHAHTHTHTHMHTHTHTHTQTPHYTSFSLEHHNLDELGLSCHQKLLKFDNTQYNSNKYISRALNPSVRKLPEAPSAVHVQPKLRKLHIQLKPSKQWNQRLQKNKTKKNKTKKSRGWAGKGARSKCQVNN